MESGLEPSGRCVFELDDISVIAPGVEFVGGSFAERLDAAHFAHETRQDALAIRVLRMAESIAFHAERNAGRKDLRSKRALNEVAQTFGNRRTVFEINIVAVIPVGTPHC